VNHKLPRLALAAFVAMLSFGSTAMAQSVQAPPPSSGSQHDTGPIQGTTAATGYDIIAGTPGFRTFASAIAAAGLADTLRGPGPYTILAPTDEAFARLPQGQLDSLLKPENRDRLRTILQYFIIPQAVTAEDVRNMRSLPTLEGDAVVIKKSAGGSYTVNGANITQRDIQASNGQIEVIDSVILPNRRTPPDQPRNPKGS
jgi:uncharacterized surface protein with fasciclin (FAS1) repeats